jgi:hypothetical protein
MLEHHIWKKERFSYPDSVPTMISAEEKLYLYWLGKRVWSGEGKVVEIGPWLGGSTICLAAGMSASGHNAEKCLHTFDNFIWREFMSARAHLSIGPGDSFKPFFLRNIQEYEDIVEPHESALPDEVIADDREAKAKRFFEPDKTAILEELAEGPIELLFIDGAKSWLGICYLLWLVREHLMPGKSYIVCQDYKYWGTYWIPVFMERLRSFLTPVHNVLGGTTVTFRIASAIPHDLIETFKSHVADLSTIETLKALEEASMFLSKDGDTLGGANVLLGKVSFLVHQGKIDEAVREFKKIQSRWPRNAKLRQLEKAREYLRIEQSFSLPRPFRIKILSFLQRLTE